MHVNILIDWCKRKHHEFTTHERCIEKKMFRVKWRVGHNNKQININIVRHIPLPLLSGDSRVRYLLDIVRVRCIPYVSK